MSIMEAQESNEIREDGVLEVSASKKMEVDGEETVVTRVVDWYPGRDTVEAVSMFGEDTVFDLYTRAAKIKLQAQIRARIEQGATQEQISEEFSEWRPDEDRTPTRDPKAAILSNFNKLDADEREAILAMLRGEG